MKRINLIFMVCILAMMSGCAPKSFVRPSPDTLTLGHSKYTDIVKAGGTPTLEKEDTVSNEKIKTITYDFHDSPTFWGMTINRRSLVYATYQDVMVGEVYNSTFSGESTDFDTDKIGQIKIGKSTESEVISLLGKPSGRIIYPIVADKNGSGLVYAYTWTRFAGLLTLPETTHYLVVALDGAGMVSKVDYFKNGVEQKAN